jgi:hypothetical protein
MRRAVAHLVLVVLVIVVVIVVAAICRLLGYE